MTELKTMSQIEAERKAKKRPAPVAEIISEPTNHTKDAVYIGLIVALVCTVSAFIAGMHYQKQQVTERENAIHAAVQAATSSKQ